MYTYWEDAYSGVYFHMIVKQHMQFKKLKKLKKINL